MSLPTVAKWDEYSQGYDAQGRLVVCICGVVSADGDWSDHHCPYDPPYGLSGSGKAEGEGQ